MIATRNARPLTILKVSEAAAHLGVPRESIQGAIRCKQIRGMLVGRVWFVNRSDVETLFAPLLSDAPELRERA